MRSITAAFIAASVLAAAAPALAETTVVQIDQATRLSINGAASSVFTGNAAIADVAIVNRNTLVVMGKGYGMTNVVALDSAGRTIMNRQVQVGPSSDGRMTLYRGVIANNYACAPMCERTPMPGEPTSVYEPHSSPYESYNKRQTTSGAAAK